jgi:4-hydroxy-2-oxoheptanedioate aldolase
MSTVIKVDQDPRTFLAQRSVGAGFQGVLFADCRHVDDVKQCVAAVRPDTPADGGTYGTARRRFAYVNWAGSETYVQALRDVVLILMIEKRSAVDQLEELLSVPGIDMIQWGSADYAMSVGRPGQRDASDIVALEPKIIETALRLGVTPRAELRSVEQARRYLDMGVRHFTIGMDMLILHDWWKVNGEALRNIVCNT